MRSLGSPPSHLLLSDTGGKEPAFRNNEGGPPITRMALRSSEIPKS